MIMPIKKAGLGLLLVFFALRCTHLFAQCEDCEDYYDAEGEYYEFEKSKLTEEVFFGKEESPEIAVDGDIDFKGAVSSAPEEKVLIKKIKVSGSKIITERELKDAVSSYENKRLSLKEMQTVADRITLVYHKRGYVASGAYVPFQDFEEGVLQIRVVEEVAVK